MSYPAGSLQARIRFERRAVLVNADGNVEGDWAELFALPCGIKQDFGPEAVEAGRLQSTVKVIVTLHRSTRSRQVTAADRGIITGGPFAGAILQIRSIIPRADGATIEIRGETGVAT